MSMTCCFEPLKDKDRERRDGLGKKTLGNTGKPRKQPHRGCDWGYKNGSKGRPYVAIHSGEVTQVLSTGELGWSIIIKREGCTNEGCVGAFDEYNHSETASKLKKGDKVVGGKTELNDMSDNGSRGAPHLHASSAYAPVPHSAPVPKLRDLFADIDASSKQRKANKEAKEAAAGATPAASK